MGTFKCQGPRRAALTDDAFEQWVQSQIELCAEIEREAPRRAARAGR